MNTARKILESLNAAELRQRIEAIDRERQALVILHRAAIRLSSRQPDPAHGRKTHEANR